MTVLTLPRLVRCDTNQIRFCRIERAGSPTCDSPEMVKRIYAHLGDVRHRSEVVEYRGRSSTSINWVPPSNPGPGSAS